MGDLPANIVCMKWGDRYDAAYVNKLYGMAARNLTRRLRFTCLTDDASGLRPEVETLPIPDVAVPAARAHQPWRKIALFAPELGDLSGPALFLDLDVLITGSIDALFELPGEFCIIENWTQMGTGEGNTSVFRFVVGAHADLFADYHARMDEVMARFRNEQNFVSHFLGRGAMTFWPAAWVKSFKRHCVPPPVLRQFLTPAVPADARIIAFHGDPKMPDVAKSDWSGGGMFKFVRRTPWIDDYWRE